MARILIDCGGGFAAFAMAQTTSDWPRRMSPAAKTPSTRGHEVGGGDVAAIVERETELLDHAVADGAEETHGEQNEIDVESELGAGLRFELWRRADADGVQLLDVAVLVAGELDGVDGPVADAAFFVRAFGAQLQRPKRPGRGGERARPAAWA